MRRRIAQRGLCRPPALPALPASLEGRERICGARWQKDISSAVQCLLLMILLAECVAATPGVIPVLLAATRAPECWDGEQHWRAVPYHALKQALLPGRM